jgi:hypothetical protein
MANSDHMAVCLQREEARVALAELREVMQQHNLSIDITNYGDVLQISQGHTIIKTIDSGTLDAEYLQGD